MRHRCSDKFPGRKWYRDRGISVCREWEDFEVFSRDMGPRPSAEHTVERIDVDSGYSKSNCRWATQKEQSRNKTDTCRMMFLGSLKPLIEVAELLSIKPNTLFYRLRRGWTDAEACQGYRNPRIERIPNLGVERTFREHRLNPHAEEVLRMRIQGSTLHQIAAKFGVDHRSVSKFCASFGVKPSAGKDHKDRKDALTEEIFDLYKVGDVSTNELALRYGVGQSKIHYHIQKARAIKARSK